MPADMLLIESRKYLNYNRSKLTLHAPSTYAIDRKMNSKPYQYTELDAASRQIRLAHIKPGEWDDPISCYLHLASLDLSPTYKTLSYVWGDQKITKPIALEGCDFEVTINLHEAL
jgi:hypothetical protein